MATAEKNKGWSGKRLVFTALTWIFALLLVEVAVRVISPEAGRPVFAGYPAGLIVPNDDLGHFLAPNFNGFFPSPRYRETPVTTNGHGFRDNEWAKAPDPIVPRVMVLGDSITFGSPLRAEDRFSEQAGGALLARGFKSNIYNCGVPDTNLEQYLTLLRLHGPGIKPHVVLIGYCLNDAQPMSPADAAIIANAQAARAGSGAAKFKRFTYEHRLDLGQSYAVSYVRRAVKRTMWASAQAGQKMADQYSAKTKRELQETYASAAGMARLRDNLTAIKTFAREQLKANVALLIFAYQHQLKSQDPNLNRLVASVAQELAIPAVDLYDTFLPYAADPDFYAFQDDCHPMALGHRLAGEAAAGLIDWSLRH